MEQLEIDPFSSGETENKFRLPLARSSECSVFMIWKEAIQDSREAPTVILAEGCGCRARVMLMAPVDSTPKLSYLTSQLTSLQTGIPN